VRHILLLAFIFVVYVTTGLSQTPRPEAPKNDEAVFTKCWSYSLGERSGTVLARDASSTFVGTDGGGLLAISEDGHKIWSTDLGGEITSNIEAAGELLFVVTSASGKSPASTLRGVSRATGVARWSMNVANSSRQWIFPRQDSVTVISNDGTASSFEANSGKIRWSSVLHAAVNAVASADGSRILVAAESKIFVIGDDGRLENMTADGTGASYIAASSAKGVLTGDSRGSLSFFGGHAKPIWKYRTGGAISNIIPGENSIIVASHDNFVYSISSYRGSVNWKRRLAGRAAILRSLDKDILLIGMDAGVALIAIELGHGRPAGQIDLGMEDHVSGISPAGPDGRVLILGDQTLYGYSTKSCS